MIKTSKILSIILLLVVASASWASPKGDGGFWETKSGWKHETEDGLFFFVVDDPANGKHYAILTNREMEEVGKTSKNGENSYSGDVEIPEYVEFNASTFPVVGIQEYAFYKSTNLKTVTIPKTVTSIGNEAFSDCTGLQNIYVNEENSNYSAINGILLSKNQKTLFYCPLGKSGECEVPAKVTAVADCAFQNCTNLTSVVLPDAITSIGNSAFDGCSSLVSINIPSSLTTIGEKAFYNNHALNSKLVIPSGVLEIGVSAFQYCTSLNNVVLSEGINEIKNNAFRDCTSLQSIQLPSTMTSIGTFAFANTGLTSVVIPANITEIKSGTFQEAKLTYISLPGNLTAIRNKAFYNNGTTIGTLSIPASVTSIGDNAFDKTTINDIYVNNTPRHLQISAATPFNKVAGMHIHVYTQMAGIFSNSTHWSNYSDYFVGDIAIKHISTITLDQGTLTLPTNTLFQLNASISPEDADVKDVVFTSSNSDIVAIINEQTGQIKSGGIDGTAIITCTAADGSEKYATCTVTVNNQFVPATSITINETVANINIEGTLQLTATIMPANATLKTAIWESSDENIATVDANGVVTGNKPGNVTITALSADGYAETTYNISVSYATYPLIDGSDYTNNENVRVDKLEYTRSFSTFNWQALYVPFAINVEDYKDDFDFARINNVHQYENEKGEITSTIVEFFKVTSGELKPNTPYCIRAKSTGNKAIVIKDATLYKAENNFIDCASTKTKYTFCGTYQIINGTTLVNNRYYALTGGKLQYTTDTNSSLKGFRWYMSITDRDGEQGALGKVSFIVIDEDEEVTGIEEVESSDNNNIIAIFDINGRKLNELKNGINIVKYADGTTKKISK